MSAETQHTTARRGRPVKSVDPTTFAAYVADWRAGKTTPEAAAAALGISRMTFFRRLRAEKEKQAC